MGPQDSAGGSALISPLSVPEERKARTHAVEMAVVLLSVQRGTILVGLSRWGSWLVGSTGQCAAVWALPTRFSRDLSVRHGLKASKGTELQPSGMFTLSAS